MARILKPAADVRLGAQFSDCGLYRYKLTREWFEPGQTPNTLLMIGLNPSKASDAGDDQTIATVTKHARGWGFNALVVANIFAFISVKPDGLKHVKDPVGPLNDSILREVSLAAGATLCCWGGSLNLQGRDREVFALLKNPVCFGITKAGMPLHPLRQKYGKPQLPFSLPPAR